MRGITSSPTFLSDLFRFLARDIPVSTCIGSSGKFVPMLNEN